MSNGGVFDSPHCEIIVKTLIYLNKSFHSRGRGGGGGGVVLGLIFAGYLPLATQSPYPIIVYSVTNLL